MEVKEVQAKRDAVREDALMPLELNTIADISENCLWIGEYAATSS